MGSVYLKNITLKLKHTNTTHVTTPLCVCMATHSSLTPLIELTKTTPNSASATKPVDVVDVVVPQERAVPKDVNTSNINNNNSKGVVRTTSEYYDDKKKRIDVKSDVKRDPKVVQSPRTRSRNVDIKIQPKLGSVTREQIAAAANLPWYKRCCKGNDAVTITFEHVGLNDEQIEQVKMLAPCKIHTHIYI